MANTVTKTDSYTLSYDSGVQGFPSFYSYNPEYMVGMNNYFYSFSGGNLYRHNTNTTRNRYYNVNYPSELQSVFNDEPLQNKLFKTINLEGDDSWGTTLISDQQDSGFILGSYYEEKEGSFYAFIRNSGSVPAQLDEYALRSLNGIGSTSLITVVGNTTTVDYPTSLIIGNVISVGDMLYHSTPNPQLAGQVTAVNQNLPAGINQVVINTDGNTFIPSVSPVPTTVPFPNNSTYTLYIKNAVAESHGILGHYSVFSLTNSNTSKVELFAVESEAMKSFP